MTQKCDIYLHSGLQVMIKKYSLIEKYALHALEVEMW